ncbi:MAG: hypothetical protein AB1705_04185 [Verrucomicrobiota bacterium]
MPDAPQVLRIVIAYDHRANGENAKAMCDQIARGAHARCELRYHVWRFDALESAHLREAAAMDATEADMIVMAAQGAPSLPAGVEQWVASWLNSTRQPDQALVALVESGEQSHQWVARLRDVAERGQMTFFSKMSVPTALQSEPSRTRPAGAYSHWGINE